MITLILNVNNEWLQVLSSVDFDGVENIDDAADQFTSDLWRLLEDCDFEVDGATGQKSTCHGWNGANTFTHKIGPVGTYDDLTTEQINLIQRCIDDAELHMRNMYR